MRIGLAMTPLANSLGTLFCFFVFEHSFVVFV